MTETLDMLRAWFVAGVSRPKQPDLSARQMAVLLTVYRTEGPHTVRGLAATLNVSKPAITRALDRLGALDLAHRKIDPMDRRSVLVNRTRAGAALLRQMEADWRGAELAAEPPPATAPARRPAIEAAHA
jgi:DNA-binding MarR family transcriptional regulator